jgi:hypothetical protein
LPLNVLFVKVAVAALSRPPPAPVTAVLSLTVMRAAVSVPAALAMPPPLVASLDHTRKSLSVAVPSLCSPPPLVVPPGDSAALS